MLSTTRAWRRSPRPNTHKGREESNKAKKLPLRTPGSEAGGNRLQHRYKRRRQVLHAFPFKSRRRWVDTNWRWLNLFAEAVESDTKMQDGPTFAKEPYLHSQRITLDEEKLRGYGRTDSARGIV